MVPLVNSKTRTQIVICFLWSPSFETEIRDIRMIKHKAFIAILLLWISLFSFLFTPLTSYNALQLQLSTPSHNCSVFWAVIAAHRTITICFSQCFRSSSLLIIQILSFNISQLLCLHFFFFLSYLNFFYLPFHISVSPL